MDKKLNAMTEVIAKLDRLHTSPQIACRVLQVLQGDEFDTFELVELLETDPALTTSILKLVNSSHYGLTAEVASIRQAVVLLGPRSLRLAVLSFGLLKQLNAEAPAQICEQYWKMSLSAAAIASKLASRRDNIKSETAYCGGLLSDLGSLVLAQVYTNEYLAIVDKDLSPGALISEEQRQFGFSHTDLGAYLLRKWNLPEELCQAVHSHHEAPLNLQGLDHLIAVAQIVARSLWAKDASCVLTAQNLLLDSFGIDLDGFISLATEIQGAIQQNAGLFSVNVEAEIDCDQLLELAQARFNAVAMEAALDVDSLSSAIGDAP